MFKMIIVFPEAVGAARQKLVGKSGKGSPNGHGMVSAPPPKTWILFPLSSGFGAISLR
jgi:hypothetical protein